jgi:hypothetical protein
MLSTVYKWREEINQFLKNQVSNFVDNFEKRGSIIQLAYLAYKCSRK